MHDNPVILKAAVVQAAPVFFDREATIDKVSILVSDAAAQKAELVVFPEAFVPAYPRGFSFGMVVGNRAPAGRKLWQRYWENSITVPGPGTVRLGEIVRQHGVMLVIGVIERDSSFSEGTLYCTSLYFSAEGVLLGKHRKIKPTGAERLIWGEGDGSTLTVVDTPKARVGGLICWENYMPLARMAMYRQGVEIYVAPTADSRDTWQATMRHIACEGRCFVLGRNQYFHRSMLPVDLQNHHEIVNQPEEMCRGGSVIISPMGDVIAGPLFGKEGILYAELDLDEVKRSKVDFDVVGHYSRPDIFRYEVIK